MPLYITVWRDAAEVAMGDPLQETSIAIGGASVQSEAITGVNRQRNRVRLFADSNCFVTWGADPTALNDGTDGRPMGSENPEYFDIESNHRIAVIQR